MSVATAKPAPAKYMVSQVVQSSTTSVSNKPVVVVAGGANTKGSVYLVTDGNVQSLIREEDTTSCHITSNG